MRSNEYQFLLEWLIKESNVDLVIPYIKELLGQVPAAKEIKTDLKRDEVAWLRKRVVMIKEIGHAAYCESMRQVTLAAEEVFGPEVRVIG